MSRTSKKGDEDSPEKRHKELHQVHDAVVLGEGDLWVGERETESERQTDGETGQV